VRLLYIGTKYRAKYSHSHWKRTVARLAAVFRCRRKTAGKRVGHSRANDLQDGVEIKPVKYEDAANHFRFTGTHPTCRMVALVEVPSIGF
jgi:hypothetical protein